MVFALSAARSVRRHAGQCLRLILKSWNRNGACGAPKAAVHRKSSAPLRGHLCVLDMLVGELIIGEIINSHVGTELGNNEAWLEQVSVTNLSIETVFC